MSEWISLFAYKKERTARISSGLKKDVDSRLAYSCYLSGSRGKSQAYFIIGSGLAQKARLVDGDRMDILVNPEKTKGLLRRIAEGSYKDGNRITRRKNSGMFKLTIQGGGDYLPVTRLISLEDVQVVGEGITFSWPVVNADKAVQTTITDLFGRLVNAKS